MFGAPLEGLIHVVIAFAADVCREHLVFHVEMKHRTLYMPGFKIPQFANDSPAPPLFQQGGVPYWKILPGFKIRQFANDSPAPPLFKQGGVPYWKNLLGFKIR